MAITRIGNIASTIPDDSIQNVKMSNIVQSKNMIINGDMSIAQRATSTSGITGAGVFVVDRWKIDEVADSTLTMSQETLTSGDAYTNGFKKSLKVLVTTADTSLGTNQSVQLMQHVEAQNLQYLNFGTANAKNLILSFWYKSNVTGVHTVCIDKNDSTRATCPLEFTVSSADTWTKYTLNANANAVIQGSTAAIANDNGTGFRVMWGLAYGTQYLNGTNGTWVQNGFASFSTSNQQNIVASTSNYVEMTGVQLEAGTSASDFEFLPVDVNLGRCQRYYHRINPNGTSGSIGSAAYYISTAVFVSLNFPTSMRTSPSMEQVTGTNYYNINRNGDNDQFNTFTLNTSNIDSADLYVSSDVSGTAGHAGRCRFNSASGYVAFSAEL